MEFVLNLINVLLLLFNIAYIHAEPDTNINDSSDSYAYYLSEGRQNFAITVLKCLNGFIISYMFINQVLQYIELNNEILKNDYQLILQFTLLVTYLCAVCNDQHTSISDLGKFFYITLLFVMLVIFIDSLAYYKDYNFIISLLRRSFYQLINLFMSFFMFLLFFTSSFYIINIETNDVSFNFTGFNMFVSTLLESIGLFGAVDGLNLQSEFFTVLFFILWIALVVVMTIIFMNLFIASIIDSF